MSDYRVMHLDGTYQIQERTGEDWKTVDEFDELEVAKKMVRELRKGTLCD